MCILAVLSHDSFLYACAIRLSRVCVIAIMSKQVTHFPFNTRFIVYFVMFYYANCSLNHFRVQMKKRCHVLCEYHFDFHKKFHMIEYRYHCTPSNLALFMLFCMTCSYDNRICHECAFNLFLGTLVILILRYEKSSS